MGFLEIVKDVIKLIMLILGKWFESNSEEKQRKEEASKMVKEGLSSCDRAKITAGFARLKK